MGYIEYVEEMEYASRVRFIVDKDSLYRFKGLPADYELLINAILRNYSGLFNDFVFIDERYLSRVTKLSRHRMYEILVSLHSKRLVQYAPSKKCPIITFTRHRVLGSDLRFEHAVYDERKAVFGDRLNAIIKYATAADKCRSVLLLEYFGEKDGAPCGCCDVCADERARNLVKEPQIPLQGVLQLLADGAYHSLEELDSLGLTRAAMKLMLRELCDEERITIYGDKIKLKK
jgi:ATP-dependent DNA helicase RecQ